MATQSPGIYVNEIDNTSYVNVSATTGTNVCVIGYARKGPVGVPTEIYSYNSFIKTFGYPIKGTYSAMAVRNVLSAGGGVLYIRIGDENALSSSKYIVKNAVPFKYGTVGFKKSGNITKGTAGYKTNSNYVFDIVNTSGTRKTIFLRSPEGMWTMAKIYEQISKQMGATEGWQEIRYVEEIVSKAGLFSYNFEVNGTKVSEQPYYITLSAGATTTVETLAKRLNKSLSTGSNATFELEVFGSVGDVINGVNGLNNYTTKNTIIREDHIAFNVNDPDGKSMYIGFSEKIGENDPTVTPIAISFAPGSYTYEDVVDLLNSKLRDENIYVYFKEGAGATPSKIVFVSTNTDPGYRFGIQSAITADPESYEAVKDLFVTAEESEVFKNLTGVSAEEEGFKPISIVATATPVSNMVGSPVDSFYIEASGKSIFLRTVATGRGQSVKAVDATDEYGSDLFGIGFTKVSGVQGSDSINLSTIRNGNIIFYDIADINPPVIKETDTSSVLFDDVESARAEFNNAIPLLGGVETIDGNTKISAMNRDMVVFSSKEKGTGTSDLSVAVKTYVSPLYKENVYVKAIEEYEEILYNEKEEYADLNVRLTTEKEKPIAQQDANRIETLTAAIERSSAAIEQYTAFIAAKETEMVEAKAANTSHSIIVYQGNTQVEVFEDVSYDITSNNCFDKVMNESTENGGSAYIEVEIIKNDFDSNIVEIKDGKYYLGKANSDTDVEKTDAMEAEDYNLYDYAIGTDGIIEDPSDLFLEQLDKENSAIMNKDLYDFHILITPDCNEAMEVQDAATACCEERGDAIYIMDPPIGLSKDAVIDWHNGRGYGRSNGPDDTYVATYWPWGKAFDSYSNSYVWTMPSVFMAAQYCKVDKAIGPWQAPAGDTYGAVSIVDIEQPTTKADRDDLYTEANRINPFIKYGDGTIVCYGEKTMQRKNSTLTKVHTRRMMIQIKKDLRTALNTYIFMPSTDMNLSEINATINTIMQKYKTVGGVSSFKVVCDSTNNTTETLQQDIINAYISCVPVGTIEQINIDCSLDKNNETVSVA
jgi:phage tail sheath protein FI